MKHRGIGKVHYLVHFILVKSDKFFHPFCFSQNVSKLCLKDVIQRNIVVIFLFHRSSSSAGLIEIISSQKSFYFLLLLQNENEFDDSEKSN